MTTQEDLRAPFYAIWIGNLDHDGLQHYLWHQFENDFGFEIGRFGPEAKSGVMQSVEDLFEGFGYSQDEELFLESATKAAHAIGFTEASCAIVFYNLRYDVNLLSTQEKKK